MSFSIMNRTTRRPVIASVASADAEFNRWVETHAPQPFKDANGGPWKLDLRLQQLPHPEETQAALYRLHMGLSCALTARHLVEVGAFDKEEDARLLRMLGPDIVPMEMKARVLEHKSLETLRGILADELISMRKSLEKVDLNATRKRLIGQWIDRKQWFGSRIDLDV